MRSSTLEIFLRSASGIFSNAARFTQQLRLQTVPTFAAAHGGEDGFSNSRARAIPASDEPPAREIAAIWPRRIFSPGIAGPESITMKATSRERDATRGAMGPPSLWPHSMLNSEPLQPGVHRLTLERQDAED